MSIPIGPQTPGGLSNLHKGHSCCHPAGNPVLVRPSPSVDSFRFVSCIPPDPHRRLLTALTGGPRRVDDLDGREGLHELRRWGWVFG
ncbi:MAG: hypothetical protein MUP13_11505, partial [Thermoanaerobaculales bacterium]|nr:hypothetical protein [Thermoanaerobaculales bacterium]